MEILETLAKLLHFIGFSALLGGLLSQLFERPRKMVPVIGMGAGLAIVSGIGWFILEGIEDGWDEFDQVQFGIKFTLIFLVTALSMVSRKKGEEVGNEIYFAMVALVLAIFGVMIMM